MDKKTALTLLPERPGVYLFRDAEGRLLYIGKARSLKARVRSYFHSPGSLAAKTRRLVSEVADIEFILAGSEVEALLLEENLIKMHRPKFNVLLKDDKQYPYLKLAKEPFPRLTVVRRRQPDGARYFGPFPQGGVKETLRLMRRLFPLRTCTDQKFRTVSRPCLLYHIKRCPGPCHGLISEEGYAQIVEEAALFLEGKQEAVLRSLREQMAHASEAMRFEEAAQLRDRIRAIEKVLEGQTMVLAHTEDADVFGLFRSGWEALCEVFLVREGKLVGRERYVFTLDPEDKDEELYATCLRTHYSRTSVIPAKVVVGGQPEDADTMVTWLSSLRGRSVELRVPHRGELRRLLRLAQDNAQEGLRAREADEDRRRLAMEQLQEALGLPRLPRRIEGFDISNTQGTHAVASMVVFTEGRSDPAAYRAFNIKGIEGPDDFSSMAQAVARRFRRLTAKRPDRSFSVPPDLLMIDGGKGQLSAVMEALRTMDVHDQPVVALAKREEELFLPGRSAPVVLDRAHLGLRLIQQVRDEAHRFALRSHRGRRTTAALRSSLDTVEGIGPKRKKQLLKTFGSVARIKEATLGQLVEAGLPQNVAMRVKEEL